MTKDKKGRNVFFNTLLQNLVNELVPKSSYPSVSKNYSSRALELLNPTVADNF